MAIREVVHAIVVRRASGIWRAVPSEEVEGLAGDGRGVAVHLAGGDEGRRRDPTNLCHLFSFTLLVLL
jgi:hypothetical protein